MAFNNRRQGLQPLTGLTERSTTVEEQQWQSVQVVGHKTNNGGSPTTVAGTTAGSLFDTPKAAPSPVGG